MSSGQRQPRRLRITDRDRRILGFVAEHRFALAGHLAALLGITEDAAGRRMRALRAAGYLRDDHPLEGEPTLYQVNRSGLGAIGSDLPPPPPAKLAAYRHEAGVAWLAAGAHRGMFGPLAEIVSERRMWSHDRRPAGRAQPLGVRLGGVGRDGHPRLHYPDLLVVTGTGHRIAFELELTSKGVRRRERILSAYAADRRIDGVVYLIDDPARRRAFEQSVRRLGIGDRVRVQSVTVGQRREQASGSVAQRTAGRATSPRRSGPEAAP